ncbi:tetratricopeptide repeat-containing sulfotransferase family protein [Palleronia sp. KMU-117]|uniref:tetratricopeptide repeat-containing sulfotransferase family protein n=1 Tax=Palleronia sp. KMU-117 TaxID=3434108 RepID=UPI003D7209C4
MARPGATGQGATGPAARQALDQALALIRSGQRDAARARLQALVARAPDLVEARLALARLLQDAGEGEAALAQVRRAAEASGGHPQVWGLYVSALVAAGKGARARKVAAEAPVPAAARNPLRALAEGAPAAADPPREAVNALLARARSGDLATARTEALALAGKFPKSALLRNVLGVLALRREDPAEAEMHLRAALSLRPEFVDAAANLGLALLRQARPMAAVGLLRPFAARPDATVAVRANLASAYARAGLGDRALALTAPLLREAPRDPDLVAIHAEALLAEGRAAEALAALSDLAAHEGATFRLQDLVARATEAARGREAAQAYVAALGALDPETDLRLAQEQAQWGDVAGAAARARALAAVRPDDPRPFRQIGLYGRWPKDDPLVAGLRARFSDAALPASERGRFGLALAKALMDAGEGDEGFEVLVRANVLMRSLVLYNVAADEARFARVAELWGAETVARLARAGDDSVAPIFIVGLPRSGSTLIESVLARHDAVAALGESPVAAEIARAHWDQPTPEAVRAVAADLAPFFAAKAGGRARVTDKFLPNFLTAGLLAAAFPRAVIVEAARDLRATCLSIFENPLSPAGHPYSMDLAELGRHAAAYGRLMDHWAAVLGPRLHRCRYEDLVRDPEPTVRALLDAVGLPFDAACLAPERQTRRVDTLSVAQVRAPLHGGSTDRWRRHEAALAPLLQALGPSGGLRA